MRRDKPFFAIDPATHLAALGLPAEEWDDEGRPVSAEIFDKQIVPAMNVSPTRTKVIVTVTIISQVALTLALANYV